MSSDAVSWPEIGGRLAAARSYWLATVAPAGSPHVSPVWGTVVDDVWYCYSERSTVKAHNLRANPRVALHLGDDEDVCIVRGELIDIGHPADHPQLVRSLADKYTRPTDLAFLPGADPSFDVMYALEPSRALMWDLADYAGSQRRWRSDGGVAKDAGGTPRIGPT